MLSSKVKRKLDSLTELPTIPVVITSILNEIENEHYNAKHIASLIEQDQGLTAKILRVANSPFYGLARTISTVDLAIVILGSNVIKEILMSLLLQKIFQKIDSKVLDTKSFWRYSIFCGSASRYIARKLKYKLVSEAFVTGLMHDIGLLILMDKFKTNFAKVRRLQLQENYTLVEAENQIFECTHSDIGAWIAERWNFPEKIWKALEFHHTHFFIADETEYEDEFILHPTFYKIKYPLAAIISMAEWLSFECGMKEWDSKNTQPTYYISNEFVMNMVDNEYLKPDAALTVVKQGILDEYEKAALTLI
ncbi:MAG: HDOD domain-containing protein [Lactococcus lactis]|jgi:HD-like signal output (HDOD) protein|nr:HDOD domain-containing protein [Lactococcus lactis]